MISNRENYLMLLNGQIPAFLPKYDMMGWSVRGNPKKKIQAVLWEKEK